ncbi:MAG: ATP-binding protein [Candidatus Rokubacteria bacterium]|nr:ATP-binding protein [Candidatus Rokubacteria bacterium]
MRVAAGPPVTVLADERLLRRALWNLVENAAKHGAPPIVLDAGADGDHVVLAVTDHGPGIPAAARARVLEPFYRVDRARTPGIATSGFGLGLAFVRRVVDAHGGMIAIGPASAEAGERGCRVTLTLPAKH